MNWTGGRLKRHSKSSRNEALQRQKEHFAKARQSLQHESLLMERPFVPSWLSERTFGINFAARTTRASPTPRHRPSRAQQKNLEEYASTAPLAHRLATLGSSKDIGSRPAFVDVAVTHVATREPPIEQNSRRAGVQLSKTCVGSIASLTNSRRIRRKRLQPADDTEDAIEESRQRLLRQNDWVGLRSSRPLQMKFAESDEKDRIGKRRKTNRGRRKRINDVGERQSRQLNASATLGHYYEDGPFMRGALLPEPETISIRIGDDVPQSQMHVELQRPDDHARMEGQPTGQHPLGEHPSRQSSETMLFDIEPQNESRARSHHIDSLSGPDATPAYGKIPEDINIADIEQLLSELPMDEPARECSNPHRSAGGSVDHADAQIEDSDRDQTPSASCLRFSTSTQDSAPIDTDDRLLAAENEVLNERSTRVRGEVSHEDPEHRHKASHHDEVHDLVPPTSENTVLPDANEGRQTLPGETANEDSCASPSASLQEFTALLNRPARKVIPPESDPNDVWRKFVFGDSSPGPVMHIASGRSQIVDVAPAHDKASSLFVACESSDAANVADGNAAARQQTFCPKPGSWTTKPSSRSGSSLLGRESRHHPPSRTPSGNLLSFGAMSLQRALALIDSSVISNSERTSLDSLASVAPTNRNVVLFAKQDTEETHAQRDDPRANNRFTCPVRCGEGNPSISNIHAAGDHMTMVRTRAVPSQFDPAGLAKRGKSISAKSEVLASSVVANASIFDFPRSEEEDMIQDE